MKRAIILAMVAAALGGCASSAPTKATGSMNSINVEKELADAANSAATSLRRLAEVEQAKTPSATLNSLKPASGNIPKSLDKRITVSWVGPVSGLLKRIADNEGYKYNAIGREPAVPIIVSIEANNEQLVNVIRDAGLQSGNRAKILVNPKLMTIELAYAP